MERTPLDEKRQRSASRFERVEGETAPTTSMRPSTKAPVAATAAAVTVEAATAAEAMMAEKTADPTAVTQK